MIAHSEEARPLIGLTSALPSLLRSLLSLARSATAAACRQDVVRTKNSPETCATAPDKSGTEFAGAGRDDRVQNPAVCRGDRFRIHRKPKGRIFDVELSKDRAVYAKLANLRSLPATLWRAEAPEPTQSGCRATQMPLVEAISSHAFAAERIHATTLRADPGQTQGPKRRLWTSDKAAHRARSAAALSLLLAGTLSVSIQHTPPAGGLRGRRERIGPLVAMNFLGPHTSPLPS
ncbi:hypothetical protein ACVWZK_008218 [Bradyrhizobium sp. GM0.4]